MRRILTAAGLVTASTAAMLALTAAPASANPCMVHDQPEATFDGRVVTVDLHTHVECFGNDVVDAG